MVSLQSKRRPPQRFLVRRTLLLGVVFLLLVIGIITCVYKPFARRIEPTKVEDDEFTGTVVEEYAWGAIKDIDDVQVMYNKAFAAGSDLFAGKKFTRDKTDVLRFSEFQNDISYFFCYKFFLALSRTDLSNTPVVVYLITYSIERFTARCLHEKSLPGSRPFVLVTGCSDDAASFSFFAWERHTHASTFLKTPPVPLTALLDHPRLLRWYAQACDVSHPKVTCLPIGIDFHTMVKHNGDRWAATKQERWLLEMIHTRWEEIKGGSRTSGADPTPAEAQTRWWSYDKPYHIAHPNQTESALNVSTAIPMGGRLPPPGDASRAEEVLVAFTENTNPTVRSPIRYHLRTLPFCRTLRTKSPLKDVVAGMLESAFIAAPPGNGYDCHRTWEALATGCIPILLDPKHRGRESAFHPKNASEMSDAELMYWVPKTLPQKSIPEYIRSLRLLNRSKIIEMFEGFPVVIVDDYRKDMTLNNLREWRKDIFAKWRNGEYDLRRLRNDYWFSRFRRGV